MSENAETLSKRFTFVPPGGGSDHDWSADHIFVKVSAADTGGQYTLVEDNLKANFALGLHMHRYHAETFYILEGSLDFFVDGEWVTAVPGVCLHIPPGIPARLRHVGRIFWSAYVDDLPTGWLRSISGRIGSNERGRFRRRFQDEDFGGQIRYRPDRAGARAHGAGNLIEGRRVEVAASPARFEVR